MRFATLTQTTVRYRPEGFRLLHNKGGNRLRRWLVGKMWKWLHNCGALRPYEHITDVYEFGPNEEKQIYDKIQRQILEMIDGRQSLDDYAVIVGAETFHEMTRAVVDDYRTFEMQTEMRISRCDGYRAEISGILVHIVPRMEGIAMVPKVVIENRKAA